MSNITSQTGYGNRQQKTNGASRQSRLKDFTEEDKRKLVSLVKNADHLWNPKNVDHSNSKALENTWTEIALEMAKSKEACKTAWVALRESYRYHTRISKRVRVYGEDGDPLKHVRSDWEFIQDMTFLDDATNFLLARKVRRITPYKSSACDPNYSSTDGDDTSDNFVMKTESTTFSDPVEDTQFDLNELNENGEIDNNDELSDLQDSQLGNYNTVLQKPNDNISHKKEVKVDKMTDSISNSSTISLIKQVGHLVKAQTEFIHLLRGSGAGNLVFHTQLSACDSLLQQLPRNKAESTLMEMQTYIIKKVTDHHRRQMQNGT